MDAPATLVTGAASGIGRAVALRLANDGHRLALVDLDAGGLGLVATQATDAGAPDVVALTADVASAEQTADAVTRASDHLHGLDAMACAAGVLEPAGLTRLTASAWERHLAVNAGGVLHTLQAGAPLLADGGAVVVVGSNAARVPRTGMLAYAASKAAAAAVARCAGLELAGRRIRVNVVEPGSTDTAMQRSLWPDRADPDAAAAAVVAGDAERFRLGIPLGRLADPDDVAAVVCFLLSPPARHVTLQQLYVDGGASL